MSGDNRMTCAHVTRRPGVCSPRTFYPLLSPHTYPPLRAVGRTFEFTFPLPEPSNAGGRPPTRTKPAGKPPRKSSTSTPPRKANPKAQQTKPRPEPATTEVEAKLRESFPARPEGEHFPVAQGAAPPPEVGTTPEGERIGTLCGLPLTGHTGPEPCSTRAEKHKASRRRWQAQRRSKKQEELRKEPPSKGTRHTGRPRPSDNTPDPSRGPVGTDPIETHTFSQTILLP